MSLKRMPIMPSDTITEEAAARKNLQRRRTLSYLIKATEQLIQEAGLQHVTSRMIGSIAGYSSSTIYSYFEDVNELILFASIGYLREYLHTLSGESFRGLTSKEYYIQVTHLFTSSMFENPEIFYNMFFGPHRDNLCSIIQEYYDLFPEEISTLPVELSSMVREGNLYERHRYQVRQLIRDGYLSAEHEEKILNLVIRMQQSFLIDLRDQKEPDAQAALERFMELLHFILDSAPATEPI